jgi:hypothetical protein
MSNVKSLLRISAGLLVLGAIGVAAQAQAQTVTMPFDGNVPGSCAFGTVTPGVLAKPAFGPGANYVVMATGGGLPIPPTGTASSVTVTCTNNSVLTIAPPTGSGPVGFAPAVRQAIVQRNNNAGPLDQASANVGGVFEPGGPWNVTNPTMPLNPGPQLLNVSMVAGNGPLAPIPPTPLPTGNYSYTVNLSITGN